MTIKPIVGGCQCGSLRFELRGQPLFTHACHCLNCQRRSGTAFGMTTSVLRSDLAVTSGNTNPKQISPRTTVYQCSACDTTIYSESIKRPSTFILPGGVVDDPTVVEPGAHIWVKRKHPWLVLPTDVPQFDEDYETNTTWPREALDRLNAANTE